MANDASGLRSCGNCNRSGICSPWPRQHAYSRIDFFARSRACRPGGGAPLALHQTLMTAEETTCFKLLDEYSRTRHRCFLAEMFSTVSEYTLCFRSTGVQKESASRYACRYLRIGTREVSTAARNGILLPSTTEMLDRELSALPQS